MLPNQMQNIASPFPSGEGERGLLPQQRERQPTPQAARLMRCSVLLFAVITASCATSSALPQTGVNNALPPWLGQAGPLIRDGALEETAAMLCAQGSTGAVIDAGLRQVGHLYDGQLVGMVRVAASPQAARAALAKDAPGVLLAQRMTHAGVAQGRMSGGNSCAAVAAVRRLVTVNKALPASLPDPQPFPLDVTSSATSAVLFVAAPNGQVSRHVLSPKAQGQGQRPGFATLVFPDGGLGRYQIELIVGAQGDDPEVALLWPLDVGQSLSAPPHPRVLFPDAGHPDRALTSRAQALVLRLRTQQEVDVLKLVPALGKIAVQRAHALADKGALGHRLPDGKNVADNVREQMPWFQYSRLSEVQAQAGTLAGAWEALLDSPAHRYELVESHVTHFAVAVVRSQDGAGRDLITLVVLLARRVSDREVSDLRAELTGKLNLARDQQGAATLIARPSLQKWAQQQADAMAQSGLLDDTLLGGSVSQLALNDDGGLEAVSVVTALLDDPLRLAVPPAVLAQMGAIGVGLRPGGKGGQWAVCVLVAALAP